MGIYREIEKSAFQILEGMIHEAQKERFLKQQRPEYKPSPLRELLDQIGDVHFAGSAKEAGLLRHGDRVVVGMSPNCLELKVWVIRDKDGKKACRTISEEKMVLADGLDGKRAMAKVIGTAIRAADGDIGKEVDIISEYEQMGRLMSDAFRKEMANLGREQEEEGD